MGTFGREGLEDAGDAADIVTARAW